MTDTKKEHYVPRCYLKNFALENTKIKIFDKFKMQTREQRIMEVAMENYFYDLDFSELIQKAELDENKKLKNDLKNIMHIDNWEYIKNGLDKKFIEKKYFAPLEQTYSDLLETFIYKSHDGNNWVINNCKICSETEKRNMALFIAIQITRTKSYRENLNSSLSQFHQALEHKLQIKNKNSPLKELFKPKIDDDYVKSLHSMIILDVDNTIKSADILDNHVWVIYVNKTDTPFYTSDNPVVTIPHKKDKYLSYSGLASEGVEVAFPISPQLMLAMYDKKMHENNIQDRQFIALTDKNYIEYYNRQQVLQSYRCVFSVKNNFELAQELCNESPELQKFNSRVKVS